MNVLLDRRRGARPQPQLGRDDPAGSQPAGKKIEEMHAMLDEDPSALGPVPEPVTGPQVLVGSIILKGAVQELSQHPGLHQAPDRVADGVVPLHQVGHKQAVALVCLGDHLVRLGHRHRQGFFADHVLAGS